MARATIVVSVDCPDEVRDVAEWFAKWKDRLSMVSDDYGCGCCVNIWDVEGPDEAIQELPEVAVTGWTAAARAAQNEADRRTSGTPAPKTGWQALADEGPIRKIAAIKAYQEQTGTRLAEAKRAVEEYIEGRR